MIAPLVRAPLTVDAAAALAATLKALADPVRLRLLSAVASRANGEATAPNTRLRSSAPVDTNVVVAAQRALSRYGYDPGPADGMFNPSTRDAVLQFQSARGMKSTGELDSQTLAALGIAR